ncbi:unnamed protein product [Closterium sp. NIES-53]
MATPSVHTFDAEGRAVDFEVWVDDLQLFLQCDRTDGLSLFDLTSGASPAPAADADATVRSQWATRDAAARLSVRRHLPTTERAHFSQYKSAKTLYDAIVACYYSPATAALSRLILPYLFPDLAAFTTVADLITHLRTSDIRYRAALLAEFCARNHPPYDHFLSVCPTTLTVDLLEERLLAAEKSIVAVGASRGDPRTPVFEGCSPSPLLPSVASAAAADLVGPELVGAASAPSGRRRFGKGKGGKGAGGAGGGGGGGGGGGEGGGGGGGSGGGGGGGGGGASGGGGGGGGGGGSGGGGGAGRGGSSQRVGSGGGQRQQQQQQRIRETPSPQQLREWYTARKRGWDAWRHQFPDATEIPRWGELFRAGVAIFDLDYDAILAAMYALTISDEGECYRCFPPDPGIEATALGADETAALGASNPLAPGAGESALSGTASAPAIHTFTLESGASRSFFRDRTTLTPLSRPVAVSLADPSGGPVLAHFSTVLPCPAGPSGTLSGHHLATFTRQPGSSLYTLTTESPPVAESAKVAASGQVFAAASRSGPESAPCSCCLLSHQTLLWHHRLGHPSLPRLRGMASRVLVSGLPRSLPPLPPGPAPTCVPCVEGWQRAAPHSSEFPPTEAPLQTLHINVKGEVTEVLIAWIRAARLQLRESFGSDCPILRLHSDRGGEFSSDLLRAFCRARGIRQTFMLPDSPQQNGIAERRIGMVMDVARTSMVHAAAPHFLWPFAVQYAAHQINLQPRVSMPETSPTLLWTGKVGDASAFRVWGSRAFVRDLSADKLSPRAVPCDVTFDESVPYYRLFPYRTASLPPPPLFLTPGPPPVHPLPPQGPVPSGVSQVDAVDPVEVAIDSGVDRGAEPAGAGSGGAGPGGAGSGGNESGGATPGGAASVGAEPGGAADGGAESEGAGPAHVASGGAGPRGSSGASSRRELLSPQELREWFARRWRRAAGAGGAGNGCPGAAGRAGASRPGAGGAAGVGATESAGAGPAASSGGLAGAGAAGGVGTEGSSGAGASEGPGVGTTGAGGAAGAGAVVRGAGAVPSGAGGAQRPRPYFVPLLEQVLGLPPSAGPTPPLECPPPVQSESQFQPTSPLPAPSPYTGPTGGLAERREPASRPASPVHASRARSCGSRQRPPPVPGTHRLSLRPSTAPLRAPLPSPPESSLPVLTDPGSDSLRAASPAVMRLLAIVVTDPSLESAAASALVSELVDFAAHCRLDYTTSLVAEQEEFQCFAAASPHLVSMQLAPEGDPDAPDIPTPRSYAEAIEGPYSSQWKAAMDAEMTSWKSTGTYVDEVPPLGANIVSGMLIFRVKRSPGSPPVFKARYVAQGFSQRQGVDYFQTFSPTPKMTTLQVLLHIATHRDYELHSLDFSTAFLQGSLHEEIWLRSPPGFTGSFPPGTQWSLRRPVYGLRQAPREWHDTLRITLAVLGFAPSTADLSLFLRTDTSLPPFYILMYVDDLVFATADTAGLAHVKSELQKRYTCTDLGEPRSYLGLQITRDRAQRTITLTQSHMVQQVLQHFGFTYSSPQATPLSTRHSLSALPSDESVESSGPYPELVGCLMYLMTCTRPDLAYPLSILARYVAPGRHRPEHMAAAKRVLRYLCSTSGLGLVLGGRSPVVLTSHADASWVDDLATQRSSQGYTFSLGSGSVSWRSTRSSSVLSSSCEAEIYSGAMAAQELRWLTYLLTDLGEPPCSPPVLYVDNKAMLALCREHRLEHRTKHIALRYFLARELQQRGQLRLAYVASQANTADISTKATDEVETMEEMVEEAVVNQDGRVRRTEGVMVASVQRGAREEERCREGAVAVEEVAPRGVLEEERARGGGRQLRFAEEELAGILEEGEEGVEDPQQPSEVELATEPNVGRHGEARRVDVDDPTASEEAQKKAEEEAEKKMEEEMQESAVAEARMIADAETPKIAEAEVVKKAVVEAQTIAAAETEKKAAAEALKIADAEAQKKAEAEVQKKAEAEAQKKAEAEAQKKVEEEAQKKVEAEAQKKAEAEAQKLAEAEVHKKANAEAPTRAMADAHKTADGEAQKYLEAKAQKRAEVEERKIAEAEVQQMPGAKAEGRKKADAESHKLADEELQKSADAEAPKFAEPEAKNKVEAEAQKFAAQKRAEAEPEKKAEAEEQKCSVAESQKIADAEVPSIAEAEAQKHREAVAQRRADADAQKFQDAEAQKFAVADAQTTTEPEAQKNVEQRARRGQRQRRRRWQMQRSITSQRCRGAEENGGGGAGERGGGCESQQGRCDGNKGFETEVDAVHPSVRMLLGGTSRQGPEIVAERA